MSKRNYQSAILALAVLTLGSVASSAQFLGNAPQNNLRDMSAIKLPAGSTAAIVVFEDLGCPACAHDHAIEAEAARRANVPLLRYDFPIAGHVWTFQGAVCARYIQNKISPSLADQFRRDVFASQNSIANKDDLQQFTQTWLQRHGQQMPFVIDPNGSLAKAVQADYDLGLRVNVQYTPTVIVVTKDQHQIVCGTKDGANDATQILPVVQAALAQTHTPRRVSAKISSTRVQ